jgi:hypothetical protein
MTRHKDFGSEPVANEPVTFTLHGQAFTAAPAIQGAYLLHFVSQADSGDGGQASAALMSFYQRVLAPESWERFEKLINDPDTIVSIEQLTEIVGWMVSEYTKRPTPGSSSSSPGPSIAGPTSTALPYSPASTSPSYQ